MKENDPLSLPFSGHELLSTVMESYLQPMYVPTEKTNLFAPSGYI